MACPLALRSALVAPDVRAAGAVGSISKSVMTDVLGAYLRQETGL